MTRPQQTLLQAWGDSAQLLWWLEDPHQIKTRRKTLNQPLEPDKTPTWKLDSTEKVGLLGLSGAHQEFSISHISSNTFSNPSPKNLFKRQT